ncbi:MAG: tyrosine-type recombinase/integrase [Jatrophihabitantaceae bacterium]
MSRSRIAPSEGIEALLAGFVDYLREQRCVSPLTVDAYTSDARRFLERRVHGRLRELTACDVSSAVLGEMDGHAAATVRRFAGSLRAFLRYAYLAGLVESDLSAAVLPVSGRRTSLLPLGLTEAQTRALLRSCDRRRAVGRRDYAMIMLMLRLGLRAREVADLELDDIDWRAGTVTVHGKRTRTDQLPLPVDVGTAITSYLQHGRPRTVVREIFIRTASPAEGVSRSAVSSVVRRASERAGLEPFGSHRLRHTTACQMLRAGGSLVEIGQVLRHDSLGSTARYARVDVERLRTIARAWPTGSAS